MVTKAKKIKVSILRFYWDDLSFKLTEKQKITIFNFMLAKGMVEAVFGNSLGKTKTFQDQFSKDEGRL